MEVSDRDRRRWLAHYERVERDRKLVAWLGLGVALEDGRHLTNIAPLGALSLCPEEGGELSEIES